ncbi:GDSL-type esterase/lipase family protein [Nocardia takedensis]
MSRGLAAFALAAAALAPALPSASAEPAPGSAVVVMGDSFSANGFRWQSDAEQCLRGPASWPTQLSGLMGIAGTSAFRDESCSGAAIETDSGYSLVQEAINAAKAGGFGPATRLVTIQFGLNDSWGLEHTTTLWRSLQPCIFNLADGCGPEAAAQGRLTDFRGVSGTEYADRVREVVTYVRYYAPNARIVLVGYPEIYPAGQDFACVNVLGVGQFVQCLRALGLHHLLVDAAG